MISLRVIFATLIALTAHQVLAQPYPSRPIKIIVAYAAGQGTDIASRYLAEQLGKELGQSVIIDNKPGAGGNLGTDAAAKAAPDGYTLTMGTNATHVLNQYLYASLYFDPEKDFEAISLIGSFPMMIASNSKSSFRSVVDVVKSVKSDGRSSDFALPSTSGRLVISLLKERSKTDLFEVPYKASGSAITDVIGGQVPLIVDTPAALRAHVASGTLRALAVTSKKPSGLAPGVKTVAEQGFDDFEVIAWNGLYAPRGTPAAVIATLNAAVVKVMSRPETRQKFLDIGFDPEGGSALQLTEFARSERKKWEPLIKAAGIRLE